MDGRYERNPGRLVELTVGGSQDVLDLQWKDEIAHVICVTLIGPPAVSAGAANAVSCVAFVQWGAGEAEAEAEIDFGIGGVVFTLPASAIRITAEYEGNFAAGESPQPIRVGAFASVGSGARQTKLTRTRFVGSSIDPGATSTFEVPPFAKALRVLGGDQASRVLRLDFFSDPAGPTPLYSVFSVLKRGLTGVYQAVSPAHLHRYLAEFDFRYSNRERLGINDVARANRALVGAKGKRLTYRKASGART